MTREAAWIAFGFAGQALFTSRFLVQWLSSERLGRSVIPRSFWYLSIAGSAVLLTYAIHRSDPVIITGQLFGFVVYIRNLQLLRRPSAATTEPAKTTATVTEHNDHERKS